MRKLGLVGFLDWNTASIQRWVCEECGQGMDLVHFTSDEEELENELELYGDDESLSHIHQVKGGELNLAENINNTDTATLCPTKAGNGYRVVVDGTWFYTSKASLQDVVSGKAKACTFSTIKDEEVLTG